MSAKTIPVDAEALRHVLTALCGYEYQVRELQVTMNSTEGNPIDTLLNQFNAWVLNPEPAAPQAAQAAPVDALGALHELVRLKDLKDSQRHSPNPQRSDEWKEHDRLAPAAWQAAHVALAARKQGEGR